MKKQTEESGDKAIPSSSPQRETFADLNRYKNLKQSTKADIFMISTPGIEYFPISHTSKYELKDLEQFHIMNTNARFSSSRQERRPLPKDLSTDSESVYGDTNQPKSYRVRMGEILLSEMMKQLMDENAYIHYFKQLVELEESAKMKGLSSNTKFDIEPFISFKTTAHSKVKNKNSGIHNNKSNPDQKIGKIRKSNTEAFEQPQLDSKLSRELLIRRRLRTEMLKDFSSNVYNENDYDKFVCNLLNLEEGLIEG